MKMQKIQLAVLPLLFSAVAAFAQVPQSTIRESTDPARVAEVERRAQELRGQQPTMGADARPRMQRSMPEDHAHGRMQHDGKRHHKHKHGHHRMHHDHPKAAPGAGK